MDDNGELNKFNEQFTSLMKNIRSGVESIEHMQFTTSRSLVSPLSQILSEIEVSTIKLSSMRKISDKKVQKGKVISYLTLEMEFLNTKYPYLGNSIKNNWPAKWWKSVNVVLDSISNYFKIPYWDIVQEVVKISSIFVGIDSEL